MPDQADELRKLVAGQMGTVTAKGTVEVVESPQVPPGEIRMVIPFHGWHGGKFYRDGVVVKIENVNFEHPTPDKAKLWDDLSADLERLVRVGGFDKPNLSTEALAEFWEIMQRRKEQAR